jgi:thymidylate kinase
MKLSSDLDEPASRRGALIIEFAGASCTGKSTLIQGLQATLRAEGHAPLALKAANRGHHGLRSDYLRAAARPRIAAWCLRNPTLVARSSQARQLLRAIGMVHRLRRTADLVLLDEGPVKLHQLFRTLRRARGKEWLIASMPKPDALVIVTCDPHVRLARLRQTERPHVNGLTDAEILARETGDALARNFARLRGVPAIEIDTSDGGDGIAELRDKLRRWIKPARAGG